MKSVLLPPDVIVVTSRHPFDTLVTGMGSGGEGVCLQGTKGVKGGGLREPVKD